MATSSEPVGLVFDEVYERWFGEVARWVRAFGGPEADVEDLAQEVFLVVRRKLAGFDGANLAGWLYRIASRTASDHRRRSWFKTLFLRRRDVPLEELRDSSLGPAELLERRQAQRILMTLISKMSARRRAAFVLFELEGYSAEEIAALEGVPAATVRTRLHHARKEFLVLVQRYRRRESI
jgi:RNA polymerase sigma-70 factor (ECF subfamily)